MASDRANRSEAIAELASALAKAQGVIKAAIKDSKNDHLKNRYADLASVWDACREQLSANGIAIIQDPSFNGEVVRVVTTMVHTSGQWWESVLEATPAQTSLQQIGAAITYLRRYALSSMVGIAPDDDDDANAASNQAARFSQAPASEPPQRRNEFEPTALDRAKQILGEVRSAEELDAKGPEFHKLNWRNQTERKEGGELFKKRRLELVAAAGPCHACDVPGGKHATGCPEDPANQKRPGGAA